MNIRRLCGGDNTRRKWRRSEEKGKGIANAATPDLGQLQPATTWVCDKPGRLRMKVRIPAAWTVLERGKARRFFMVKGRAALVPAGKRVLDA